jgi:hypothetical protein
MPSLVHIIIIIWGNFERRFMHNAKAIVKGFGCLFIKFPKFTYIREEGFSRRPYKLPRYPNDRIIQIELTKQLQTSHTLLSNIHRVGVPYPLTFGQEMYYCLATQCVKYFEKQLVEYKLDLHKNWGNFDPNGKLRNHFGIQYAH